MSIEPDQSSRDLDNTDELPILDVEAYEATLVEVQSGLSRTDAWSVAPLQDIDQLSELLQTEEDRPPPAVMKDRPGAEAITANVERILKRIAELESEITAAHEANGALRKRNEAIQNERDEQSQRVEALERDSARLREQHELADALAQRGIQQVQAELQQALADQRQQEAARLAERTRAEDEREALQRHIDDLAARQVELQENNRLLQEQLREQRDLADQRGASIVLIERSLIEEKANAALVARQLALKLKDCDALQAAMAMRDRSLGDLTSTRDGLTARLEQEAALRVESAAQLAAVERDLELTRRELSEREATLVRKDARIAELAQKLADAADDRDATHEESEEIRASLANLEAAYSHTRNELTQQLEEIEALRTSLADSRRAHNALQEQLSFARRALDEQAPMRREQQALKTALEQRQAELAGVRGELDSALAAVEDTTERLSETRAELLAERSAAGKHLAEISELEQALEARDARIKELAAQLQAGRDERTITADQLNVVRARVKTLTQQIFAKDNQLAELRADLAVHMEALAAIRRDVNRIGGGGEALEELERMLEPIDHDAPPIILSERTYTIGRTAQNDICIPSNSVSRRHARLLVGPTGVIIEDLGSTNGCFVNGEQVRQHLIRDGDVLALGDVRFRLCTNVAGGRDAPAE